MKKQFFYRGKPCVVVEECPDLNMIIIRPDGKANFMVNPNKVVDSNQHIYQLGSFEEKDF